MYDLIVRNCRLNDGQLIDIACANGRIETTATKIPATGHEEIDAHGYLVTPPFVDSHFHMDAALSLGTPRLNNSGTLLEGIKLWGELKEIQSVDDIMRRARRLCDWSIAQGVLAIRSHVDVSGPSFAGVEALLQVREEMRPYLDIQLVAFPQDGLYRTATGEKLLIRALDMGVDVVGGIPHYERTTADGTASVKALCEIAADRGLYVDLHCDESDDPNSRHIETLAAETVRLGLQDKVAGSHLTSMHSMDNYYATKLLELIAQARVCVIPNPLINITLQGRQDTYPKRRGLTRIREMWDHEITVALGHDCVMDPWYCLGSHDMLEVAAMAVHVGPLTAPAQIDRMFDAVTITGAKTLGLEGYGLSPGDYADFVILQAHNRREAIRLRANRLFVVRRGKVIARTQPTCSELFLKTTTKTIDFMANDDSINQKTS